MTADKREWLFSHTGLCIPEKGQPIQWNAW